MSLSFTALPSGQASLWYIPCGNCVNRLLVKYTDGTLIDLNDLPEFIISENTKFSEVGVRSPKVIDGDKFFTHIDGELNVSYHAEQEQLKSYRREYPNNPELNETRYYLDSAPGNSIPVMDEGNWERRSGTTRWIFHRSQNRYESETYLGTSLYKTVVETVEKVSDTQVKVSGVDSRNGPYSYYSSIRQVQTTYVYDEIPSWNSRLLKRKVDGLMIYLKEKASSLEDLVPQNAHWKASLAAADGVMAYDLNMVEAILGFGLDDLIPKGVSDTSLKLIEECCQNRNPINCFCNLMRISGTMYLYNKYVMGNNVQDVCDITGMSPDVGDAVCRAAHSLKQDGVEPQDINQQLYTVARKISQGEDYFSSTYGGFSQRFDDPEGYLSYETTARLRAYPGPYADVSALGIIVDEFGLKATASRLVEAAPWEFVANWFIPIEDTVHQIEYNDAHLQVLYNVVSLTLSDSFRLNLNDNFRYLHGLTKAEVSGYIRFYNRSVSDEFPPTTLSFNGDGTGLSGSRILQGGGLICSSK